MSAGLDPQAVSVDEAAALAEEAFVFGLPLVYIGVQIDTNTAVARPEGGRAPLNQFAHFRALPDASDQVVVGLNVDTLYSLGSLRNLRMSPRCAGETRRGRSRRCRCRSTRP